MLLHTVPIQGNLELWMFSLFETMYSILDTYIIFKRFRHMTYAILWKYVRYIQLSLNSVYFGDGRQLPLLLFKILVLAMKTCQMLIVTADMSKRNIFWLNLSLGIHIWRLPFVFYFAELWYSEWHVFSSFNIEIMPKIRIYLEPTCSCRYFNKRLFLLALIE